MLWVASDTAAEAAKVDPRTGKVLTRIRGLQRPIAIATGSGALWLASSTRSVIQRVPMQRVRGRAVDSIQIGSKPAAVATGGRAVWAVSPSNGMLYQIDPRTPQVRAAIPVPPSPTYVAFGHGSVWVGSPDSRTVLRVDPPRKIQRISVGRPVRALTYYDGRLWVAAG